MRLILARHGNTFAPGDPVVMAGLTNDLPLVERGEEQAGEVAQALLAMGVELAAVYASELQRTRRAGEILIETLGLEHFVTADARLNELDYGQWTGLTDAEIDKRFGEDVRLAWQKQSQWPTNAGWGETPDVVAARVASFAADVQQRYSEEATVFGTTHGGVLRYFLKLVPGEWDARHAAQTLKVKTGHLCGLTYADGQWHLDFWNKNPLTLMEEAKNG